MQKLNPPRVFSELATYIVGWIQVSVILERLFQFDYTADDIIV